MTGDGIFEPIRFNGWPELKETFLANDLEATFILAPLAMSLREQGVPIKIVYLGHRDGTTMMVHKDSTIFRIEDLRGRKIAVPNRFSNQRLIIFKALKERGMNISDVTLVEMPPPDMPAALYSRSVDAIISGEPFMAQSEMDGYGRVLFMTKDVWPDFISCVLAVPERVIQTRRADVQRLVDGIAKSGKWLDRVDGPPDAGGRLLGQAVLQPGPEAAHGSSSASRRTGSSTRTSPLVRKDFEEIEAARPGGGHPQGHGPLRRLRRSLVRPGRDDRFDPTTGRARREPTITSPTLDSGDRGDSAGRARAPVRWSRPCSCLVWEGCRAVLAERPVPRSLAGRPRDRGTDPQGAAAEVHRGLAVPRDLGVLARGRSSACRSVSSSAGSGRPTRRSTR